MHKNVRKVSLRVTEALSWYGLRGASRNYDSKLWGRLDLTAMLCCATNICHKHCSWFLSSDKTIIWLFRWNSKVNKQISGLSCNSSFTSSRRWWIGKIYFGNHCYLKYIFVVIICTKNHKHLLTIDDWQFPGEADANFTRWGPILSGGKSRKESRHQAIYLTTLLFHFRSSVNDCLYY